MPAQIEYQQPPSDLELQARDRLRQILQAQVEAPTMVSGLARVWKQKQLADEARGDIEGAQGLAQQQQALQQAKEAQEQQQAGALAGRLGLPPEAAAGVGLRDLAKILADQQAAATAPITPTDKARMDLQEQANLRTAEMQRAAMALRERSIGEQSRHNRVMETKSTAPMVTVNGGVTESEFAKLRGKKDAERFDSILTAGEQGRKMQPSIATMLEQNKVALEGPTAEEELKARQLGQRFLGVGDPEVLSATEGLRGGLSDLVLQKQILQKGPQTESDAKRIENTVSYITTSRVGREQLLNAAKASAEFDAKFSDKVEELVNGGASLSNAQRQARQELGDAPDLMGTYEKLASKYRDKVDAAASVQDMGDDDLLGELGLQ